MLVLERNAWFGGGVVTRELTVPGFLHDQHSMAHIFIQANPLLKNDELGLKRKHGLKYVFPEVPMMSVFEDGTTLGLYRDRERTCAEIAKFSKKDAETYRWLAAKAAELAADDRGVAVCAARAGRRDLRDDGPEPRGPRDLALHADEHARPAVQLFEHDKVRMHFARVAGENLVSPDEKATGIGAFVFVGFLEAYGFGVPVGGSGKLTDALIACIREHGGEVLGECRRRARSGEERPRDRRRDADGREFAAKDGVIGAIHPHDLGRDGRRRRTRGRQGARSARTSPRSAASPSTPR